MNGLARRAPFTQSDRGAPQSANPSASAQVIRGGPDGAIALSRHIDDPWQEGRASEHRVEPRRDAVRRALNVAPLLRALLVSLAHAPFLFELIKRHRGHRRSACGDTRLHGREAPRELVVCLAERSFGFDAEPS